MIVLYTSDLWDQSQAYRGSRDNDVCGLCRYRWLSLARWNETRYVDITRFVSINTLKYMYYQI